MAEGKMEVGKVIHYFPKVSVAIVKLAGDVKIGDTLIFEHGAEMFEQAVTSMQMNHAPVQAGKAGEEIAIRIDRPAKDGWLVFKA